jgi:hypothetical protein
MIKLFVHALAWVGLVVWSLVSISGLDSDVNTVSEWLTIGLYAFTLLDTIAFWTQVMGVWHKQRRF